MAKYLTNLPSDGTVLGQNATDKIGFYGSSSGAVQVSGLVLVTNAAPSITTFGFTSAQAGDILTFCRLAYSAMVNTNFAR